MVTQLSLFDGEARKEMGVNQVLHNSAEWKDRAVTEIEYLANTKDLFTCDDLRERIEAPHHGNAWGAVFNAAAKKKIIKKVGYRPSTLPSNHASVIAVWCKH